MNMDLECDNSFLNMEMKRRNINHNLSLNFSKISSTNDNIYCIGASSSEGNAYQLL